MPNPSMPEHTPAPMPIRAVYGFATYLCFRTFFVLYIIWALVPEAWFRYIGVTCLPQRYWAVAVPIYIITAVLIFGFIIYPSINLCMTPDFNDFRTITDETVENRNSNKVLLSWDDVTSNECICKSKAKCSKQKYLEASINFKEKCIPPAEDLDITEVSRLLYLKVKAL